MVPLRGNKFINMLEERKFFLHGGSRLVQITLICTAQLKLVVIAKRLDI